jgi:Tfp pilus assembly protein FimT
MAVVTIIGVMASVAMFGMRGYGDGQGAASLARGIQFAMMRARAEAVGDNTQRQLACNASGCSYQIATRAGSATLTANADFIDAGDKILATSRAAVWNVFASLDVATNAGNAAAAQMSGVQYIQFKPDGSATAATVYVSDKGKGKGNQYKIYVYPGTGMSRLVNNW